MKEIPQRDLRNNVSEILRAAEEGETYTVTVGGRPVAQLGPHKPRQWVAAATVDELLATPTDDTVLDDAGDTDPTAGLDQDPWQR